MLHRANIIEEMSRSVVSPAGAHCANRQFEWTATAAMAAVAVGTMIFPGALERGPFRLLGELGLGSLGVGTIMGTFAVLRAIALYANGNWQPYGAWLRAFGAGAAAVIWFQMMLALIALSMATGLFLVSIPIYGVLTVSELFSCYRAGFDERRPHR